MRLGVFGRSHSGTGITVFLPERGRIESGAGYDSLEPITRAEDDRSHAGLACIVLGIP
jgi:hypothetical protein